MTAATACDKVAGAPVAQSEEQRTFNPRARRSKLRGGTTSLAQLPPRMQAKIQLDGIAGRFCWNWTGAITSSGYGSASYQGRIWSTHRLSYELLIGPIPDGLTIDHLCENVVCCRPWHLEPVTLAVNMARKNGKVPVFGPQRAPYVPNPSLSEIFERFFTPKSMAS